jgi:LmbE family N-acetylglucosaminyl deacetylase
VANPYRRYAEEMARLVADGRRLPLGGLAPVEHPPLADDAARALIFSPHPDDECIIGGLALRLRRQSAMRVVNVAVTQGSKRERRAARWEELAAACHYIGFELEGTVPGGLEEINPEMRARDRARWAAAVDVVADIVGRQAPAVVFCPHGADWNSTHIGTHHLVMDALARQP